MVNIYMNDENKCDVCGGEDFYVIGQKNFDDIRTTKYEFNFNVKLVCCKLCGAIFQNPPQNKNKLQLYYSTMFREEGYRSHQAKEEQFGIRVDFACKYIGNGNKVLEIGCADGTVLSMLKSKGFEPFGIEPSTGNALFCRDQGINIFNGSYEKYPMMEGSCFDLVCSYFVLEHMISPVNFLSFCNSLLDYGKIMLIEIPDIGAYKNEKSPSDLLFFFEHQFHFSRECITILLQRCGFELIEFFPNSSNPFGMHLSAKKVSMPILTSELNILPNVFDNVMGILNDIYSHNLSVNRDMGNKIKTLQSNLSSEANIVIFGAGLHTKTILLPILKKRGGLNIKYIVDNNADKWGTKLFNLSVYSPETIDEMIDYIIISSSFEKEIYEQLIQFGIKKSKIIKLYS